MNKKTRIWIERMFINIIKTAKEGNRHVASYDLNKLRGVVQYLNYIGDLTDETWHKLQNLFMLLAIKYHLN